MPRGNKRRANARPDTQLGGPQVQTRGGVVAEQPGRSKAAQTADALTAIAGTVNQWGQKKVAEREREQAKAQQLQAYKDFHADAQHDVTLEQAKQRASFGNDAYSKTYMNLSYSQQAGSLSADIHEHARQMLNDPEVGIDEVEHYIDTTTAGAIQGVDDPDAVGVFANRLTSDAEKLKTQARQVAIERQQKDGIEKFNSHLDDLANEGHLGSAESIKHLERMGTNLNMTQAQVHKRIAATAIREADKATDPSKLDFLLQKNDDGVSLADDPAVHDKVMRAKDKIEADKRSQLTTEKLRDSIDRAERIDAGDFGTEDAMRLASSRPDDFTKSQLTSMVMRSRHNHKRKLEVEQRATELMQGGSSGMALRQQTASHQREILSSQYGQIQRHFAGQDDAQFKTMMVYAQNFARLSGGAGGISENVLGPYLNSGATTPSADGSPPPGFNERYRLWKAMSRSPALKQVRNHVVDSTAAKVYQRTEAHEQEAGDFAVNEDGSRDITPAYYQAQQEIANPISVDEVHSSEGYQQLSNAVDDVTDIASWFDWGEQDTVSNAEDVKRSVKNMAINNMRYNGGNWKAALDSAVDRYKHTHRLSKGVMVSTTRGPVPSTQAVNAWLHENVGAIREASGGGVNVNDTTAAVDAGGNLIIYQHGRVLMKANGQGVREPVVISAQMAEDAYRKQARPKGTTAERTGETAEDEAARKHADESIGRAFAGLPQADD